jgi:hypothetical protein
MGVVVHVSSQDGFGFRFSGFDYEEIAQLAEQRWPALSRVAGASRLLFFIIINPA